jgi:adenylate kinase family enzyme
MPSQIILLLKGHPGSGKSTLGRAISRCLKWPLIDKDDAKDILNAALAEADINEISYRIMFAIGRTQLECGASVIFDCPFARAELYMRAVQLAQVGLM